MSGLSIPPYQAGESLRVGTVNALIRSVGVISEEGAVGHGINTTVGAPNRSQITVSNLPANLVSSLRTHSVLYYRASDRTWHSSCVENSFPFTNENRMPRNSRLALTPLTPGKRYIIRGLLPHGTGARWQHAQLVEAEQDNAEFMVVSPTPINNRFVRVIYQIPIAAGGTIDIPPALPSDSTCEVMEPIRTPRFYDPKITPNPMAIAPNGVFFSNSVSVLERGVLAYMSMGLIKVRGKEYAPLQATYAGGETYEMHGELHRRRMGELRYNDEGKPLYLMRRELVVADNNCTVRRGGDTSFPFKWQYADGTPFSSGVHDIEGSIYNDFIYKTSRTILASSSLSNDDVRSSNYLDYFEMKPYYYYGSSIAEVENAEEDIVKKFIGISPQWWKLTTDPAMAQLDYDFACCPELEWSEVLVPGEELPCRERTAIFSVPALDEYGEPLFEKLRDQHGNIVIVGGNPVFTTKRATELRAFRYYEITPPASYLTAILGQPKVELYIGAKEDIDIEVGDSTEDNDAAFSVSIADITRAVSFVRKEDIVMPEYELVYAVLRNRASADIVNPLAVISDLQTDRKGNLTKRLRALWYKKDKQGRQYPMLFEVDRLSYGYCAETGNTQHFLQTELDQCAVHFVREEYQIERMPRGQGGEGKTLQLASTRCFKHRMQIPVLPR